MRMTSVFSMNVDFVIFRLPENVHVQLNIRLEFAIIFSILLYFNDKIFHIISTQHLCCKEIPYQSFS